jgi:hypothetical protein
LKIVIATFVELSKKPFQAFVRRGDKVRWMTVHVVLLYVTGDGKNADMLGCRYGGKTTSRLTNGCACSFHESSDPMHDCKWVLMSDLQDLYKKATSEGLSPADANVTSRHFTSSRLIYVIMPSSMSFLEQTGSVSALGHPAI